MSVAFPMEIVVNRLFDEWFLFVTVPRLGDQLAMKSSRAATAVTSTEFK